MKQLLIITAILFSTACFGQGNSAKATSGKLSAQDSAALKKQYIDSVTVAYNAPLLSIVDMINLRTFIENYLDDKGRANVIISQIEVAIADAQKRKKLLNK